MPQATTTLGFDSLCKRCGSTERGLPRVQPSFQPHQENSLPSCVASYAAGSGRTPGRRPLAPHNSCCVLLTLASALLGGLPYLQRHNRTLRLWHSRYLLPTAASRKFLPSVFHPTQIGACVVERAPCSLLAQLKLQRPLCREHTCVATRAPRRPLPWPSPLPCHPPPPAPAPRPMAPGVCARPIEAAAVCLLPPWPPKLTAAPDRSPALITPDGRSPRRS